VSIYESCRKVNGHVGPELRPDQTRPDRGSGRVRKFTGKGGSGRVQFGQKLKFNFALKCLDICILFCVLVCTMFQLYVQYLPCSFQCILGDVTDGGYLTAVASRWHDYLNSWLHSAVEIPPSMSSSVALF